MDIAELIRLAGSEPVQTVTQTVWTTPPAVLAQAAQGGMRLTDLLSAPGRKAEKRDVSYQHILGPAATQVSLEAWQRNHPAHPLPTDVQQLLSRVNGIHLWANADTGRSYVGLAPIEEWDLARTRMYGASADRKLLDDRYVAVTYHQDGAS